MFFISLIKILLLFCEVLPRGIHEIDSTSRRIQLRYSLKNGVIKNFLENSQDNTCVTVSLIKLQALSLQLY